MGQAFAKEGEDIGVELLVEGGAVESGSIRAKPC
jgi:hypothetical protein